MNSVAYEAFYRRRNRNIILLFPSSAVVEWTRDCGGFDVRCRSWPQRVACQLQELAHNNNMQSRSANPKRGLLSQQGTGVAESVVFFQKTAQLSKIDYSSSPACCLDEQKFRSFLSRGAAVSSSSSGDQHRAPATFRVLLKGQRRSEIWVRCWPSTRLRAAARTTQLE